MADSDERTPSEQWLLPAMKPPHAGMRLEDVDPLIELTPVSAASAAYQLAKSLQPDDRLRLIAQLWASLPADHWAAPTETELKELERRLADGDAEALAIVPWKIMRQIAASRPDPAIVLPKIYSAPRRFDLATIFVVMSAYSILFAAMSGLQFPPQASLMVGGFITIVGIGQAVLFGGRKPRLASVVTGLAAFLVGLLVSLFEPRMYARPLILIVMSAWLIVGAAAGYVAGVLVGGVFLVADLLRKAYDRSKKHDQADESEAEAV
jgi:putative addiction module component (TIGR02574 family)